MKVLMRGPAARADRPASELLHDEANSRIVAFHLLPGQRVPPHQSESTVVALVLAGSGRFQGADSAAVLAVGQCAVFAPGEMHAIDAGDEALRFLAIIAPRPGG
jgi:quercetin dioxygenase-like cupin family protein